MDIYFNPVNNTYVTGITSLFTMPTDSGGIPAVAVTKKTADYILSAYTILMVLIFMIGWNLALDIIMGFWPTRGDPNRQIALVALLNAGESMNAMTLMVSYCKGVILYMLGVKPKDPFSDPEAKGVQSDPAVTLPGTKTDSNDISHMNESVQPIQEKDGTPEGYFDSYPKCGVSNLLWGLLFVFIAFAITIGNAAAGVLIPVQLSMGNVAPVAKDHIFYPDVLHYYRDDDNGAALAQLNAVRTPSALRALGIIETSGFTVRERVNLENSTEGDSMRLNYDYIVTGVDMGLQSDPKLKLMVTGSCHTDYTWLLNSTDQGDTYRLFGGNDTFDVKYQPEVALPPMVNLTLAPFAGGSNISYAMIVNTGGFFSYTPGNDLWYITDPTVNRKLPYQVRRGRPVLSCWEAKRWHLNGNSVDGSNLTQLPGLKLDTLWAANVFALEFSAPAVANLATLAGPSALKSVSYAPAPSYILDADACSIFTDFERMVLASWIRSRNILRDTTTYKSNVIINLAKGPGGSVEAASAKFVLQSGDVVTLSIRILISIPVILLFLFIVHLAVSCVLRHSKSRQEPILPGEKNNGVSLVAVQLYRGLAQKISSSQWQHTDSLIPFAYPSGNERPIAKIDPEPKTGGTVTERPANADDQ